MSSQRRAELSLEYHVRLTKLGQKMLDDHGCRGWVFFVDPDMNDVVCAEHAMLAKNGLDGLSATGRTNWHCRTVSIDLGLLERRVPESEIVDVILHEIAHVLAGRKAVSHGERWQRIALEIGVSGDNVVRHMALNQMRRERGPKRSAVSPVK